MAPTRNVEFEKTVKFDLFAPRSNIMNRYMQVKFGSEELAYTMGPLAHVKFVPDR